MRVTVSASVRPLQLPSLASKTLPSRHWAVGTAQHTCNTSGCPVRGCPTCPQYWPGAPVIPLEHSRTRSTHTAQFLTVICYAYDCFLMYSDYSLLWVAWWASILLSTLLTTCLGGSGHNLRPSGGLRRCITISTNYHWLAESLTPKA